MEGQVYIPAERQENRAAIAIHSHEARDAAAGALKLRKQVLGACVLLQLSHGKRVGGALEEPFEGEGGQRVNVTMGRKNDEARIVAVDEKRHEEAMLAPTHRGSVGGSSCEYRSAVS